MECTSCIVCQSLFKMAQSDSGPSAQESLEIMATSTIMIHYLLLIRYNCIVIKLSTTQCSRWIYLLTMPTMPYKTLMSNTPLILFAKVYQDGAIWQNLTADHQSGKVWSNFYHHDTLFSTCQIQSYCYKIINNPMLKMNLLIDNAYHAI